MYRARFVSRWLSVLIAGLMATAAAADTEGVSFGIAFSLPGACAAAHGICVLSVRAGGAADRAGLQQSDVLTRIGNVDVASPADLFGVARSGHVGDSVPVVVYRKGAQITLTLHFVEADLASRQASAPAGVAAQMPPASLALPYEILAAPSASQPLIDKLGTAATAISFDSDVLSIVHRDSAADVQISGTFQHAMTRLPGTDIWVLQARMTGWDKAFFSASFYSRAQLSIAPSETFFRGEHAPPLPEAAKSLHGRLITSTLPSKFLGEPRKITVYIPPHAPKRGLRALFMADGQSCESYARIVEPLIESGRTAPFTIVGVYSGASTLPTEGANVLLDQRNREYLPSTESDTAAKHMRFFIEEVVPWASRRYGLSSKRADRAIFGFSSGGAFAASVAVEHGDLFGHALPFSMAVAPDLSTRPSELPAFHLVAGELEPASFRVATQSMHERVLAWGGVSAFTPMMSGHDYLMWEVALAEYLPHVFPP